MKRGPLPVLIAGLLTGLVSAAASAAAGGVHLDSAPIDLGDKAALLRGAQRFVDNCLGCHSAKFMRYKRVGDDLGLSAEETKRALRVASDEQLYAEMSTAMAPEDAVRWFGVEPPDLSLTARSRGPDWLYTYLRSFYLDAERPFGVNNRLFKDVAMPHALAALQGDQRIVRKMIRDGSGAEREATRLDPVAGSGAMAPEEYDRAVAELVSFMTYMGEPARLARERLGVYVLAFLALFFVVAYLLKRAYWRDIH